MIGLDRLYNYAAANKIFVYYGKVSLAPALTIKHNDEFDIAIDAHSVNCERCERDYLTHEMAHIATGTFYITAMPLEAKRRLEARANKWAISFNVPLEKLKEAMQNGYTDIYDLADYFEVTEDFMRQTIEYYTVNKGVNFNDDYEE